MTVQPGDGAPDFELSDQNGQTVKLSGFRGEKAVALVFYPFTFTSVCEGELCALRDDFSRYEDAGVQVLAISCDSAFAQKQVTRRTSPKLISQPTASKRMPPADRLRLTPSRSRVSTGANEIT